MKKLYIFPSFYPYGLTNECFLDDEIPHLTQYFDKVVLVPYCYDPHNIRSLPSKCELVPSEPMERFCYLKMLFNAKSFRLFVKDFFKEKVYASKTKFKVWLKAYGSTNYILNTARYKKVFDEACDSDVFYFYWGKSDNILASIINKGIKMVSRFHGQWDLWEEEYEGYAPLRRRVMDNLDAAIAISTIGLDYIKNKYPKARVSLYPLGSKDYGECIDCSSCEAIRVLSCSTVYPLKRVDLIFKSLLEVKERKVRWTHIGGGSDFAQLKELINSTNHHNLDVILMGGMNHNDVMEFMKSNKFDVFVNLSTLEGVPVSIMEAISFNIPVVATGVGGTPDVVQEESGFLVSPNPTEKEVAAAVLRVFNGSYNPREFWKTHYSENVNYGGFASFLSQL